jgi:TraY domain
MNRRSFCVNVYASTLHGCDMKKSAATGLNFILRVGWVAGRHISTPRCVRRANVDSIKLERGHGRDPSSVALISIQSVRQFMLDRWKALWMGRGRAPKGEYAGKTEVMSFRLTPDTKAALRRAAATSGRSLSQEAEHRLRRGLDDEEAISKLY